PAAHDCRLRPLAHRRAAGRRSPGRARVRLVSLGGCGRLERNHLRPFALLASRPAEEVDPLGHHLDRAPAPPLLFPGAAAEVAHDADPPAFAEILGAELRLAVPDGHTDEVGSGVPAAAADGEQEARHLLALA